MTDAPVTAAPVSGASVPGAPAPGAAPAPADVRCRAWADLDPLTAYALLRLRVDVFVVEQECAYPELDGRDVEPATEHRWVDGPSAADPGADGPGADGPGDAPAVGAYLRVLADPGGVRRIGRVVTAPAARGRGLAGVLMTSVVADHAGSPLVLDAQAHLQHWYARWGFVAEGGEFLEDGIPHVRMARPADRP